MAVRKAEAVWRGTLIEGKGTMKVESGAFEGAYSFATRFEEEPGTNPEELLGAAHAGCFSQFLAKLLEDAGFPPESVHTQAKVYLRKVDGSFAVNQVDLITEAKVPGIDEETFMENAQAAKGGCPVSKALAAIKVNLDAKLV